MADKPIPGTIIDLVPSPSSSSSLSTSAEAQPATGTLMDLPVPQRQTPREDPKGFLSNRPDDGWVSSAVKGFGTAAGKAVASTPGLLGDVASLADYADTGLRSLFSDKSHIQLLKERDEHLRKKEAAGQFRAPTTEELYDKAARVVGAGEYRPTSLPGRYLQTATEAGLSMLMPLGIMGKTVRAANEALRSGKGAASAARSATTAAAPAVAGAGAVGAGAQGVADATDSPGAAMAVGIGVPAALPATKGAYRVLRGSPEAGARDKFVEKMATPRETSAAIIRGGEDTSPLGAPRTTAQAYNDPGLSQHQTTLLDSKEGTVATRNRMKGIETEQNRVHENALESAAPAAANEFALTNTVDATQQHWQAEVVRLNAAVNSSTSATEAAGLMRELARAREQAESARVSRLYRVIEANPHAEAPTTNVRRAADELLRTHDEAMLGPMAPELATLIERIQSPAVAEVMPFNRLRLLDQSIEAARDEAHTAGRANLARQIGQLKTGITADLGDARIPPGIEAPEVAAALREAKDARRQLGQTYENPYIGNALDRRYGVYNVPTEDVINKILPAGDKGAGGVNAWLEAAGNTPEAIHHVQSAALAKLNSMLVDGNTRRPLTQETLNSWTNKYRSALEAIDQVSPGFSRQFDNVAAAHTELNNFTNSAAAQFLGMRDEKAVRGAIDTIVRSPDGRTQLQQLISQIPPHQRSAVMEGMQRAAANGIVERFVRPANGSIQPGMFQKYVRGNAEALRELFGNNYTNISRIADELARYERVNAAGRSYTGSPTAFNQRTELGRGAIDDNPPLLSTITAASVAAPVLGPHAAAAVGGGSLGVRIIKILEKSRNQTIDQILADAMLHPEQARALLQRTYRVNGDVDWTPFKVLLRGAQPGIELQQNLEQDRRDRGYASGGRIGALDHAAEAAHYVRLASRIKNAHSEKTKEFLNVPDATVAKALAVAHEAI